MQPGTPEVSGASFHVHNDATVTRRLQHPDAFTTLYVEVRCPTGCLSSVDGVPVGAADSVLLTLDPVSGGYGLGIAPDGLEFAGGSALSLTFSFARYGDLSVADGSPTYGSRSAYAAALALWREIAPDLWEKVPGSGYVAPDAVAGRLQRAGTYLVAAPR